MNMSTTIGQLAEALAAAQLEYPVVKKDSDNPYYSSKYADLSAIIGATQPSLAKNGLVIIQSPIVKLDEQKAGVVTTMAHKSGEWMSDECILPATMKSKDGSLRFDAQSVGSALTYARRYSYQAMAGVAAEVDDDGNAASGKGTVEAAQAVATEKLRSHARTNGGSELVTITPYKDGFLALSGSGLPVVRVEMKGDMKAKLGWVQRGNVDMFVKEHKAHFIDFCTSIKVSVIDESAGQAAMNQERPTPGVTVDDMAATFGGTPTPFSDDPSTDPLIMDANIKKGKKGEFLVVKWGGHDISCFDSKVFSDILANVKKPAMLDWTSNAKGYKNLLHIVRLGGQKYTPPAKTYSAQDSDVPF